MTAESMSLVSFADGVWLRAAPVHSLGLRLTTTMVVVKLADGTLLVWSPTELTPEVRGEVEALGPIAHLYAPDLFHHLWLGDWALAFPQARVHAPPGLRKKRPDLRIDRVHGAPPEPAFAGRVDELPVRGFRLEETALLVRPARSLVVADLVQNVGRPTHPWTAMYTKMMGFYDQVALSRFLRWTAFNDGKAARRSIDDLIDLPFDRLIVGHGAPLTSDGPDALASAYAWLRP
jgi:hypothetical protein